MKMKKEKIFMLASHVLCDLLEWPPVTTIFGSYINDEVHKFLRFCSARYGFLGQNDNQVNQQNKGLNLKLDCPTKNVTYSRVSLLIS